MCGVALETVDGGILERIAVDNITIRASMCRCSPLGHRARAFKEGMGRRRWVFSRYRDCEHRRHRCRQNGMLDHRHPRTRDRKCLLNNISLSFEGGGARAMADIQVRELEERYPESKMFGDLPAYGFYCAMCGIAIFEPAAERASSEQRMRWCLTMWKTHR